MLDKLQKNCQRNNRKNKGRQINILQLDYYRSRPLGKKVMPKDRDVQNLFNERWIKVKVPSDIDIPSSFTTDIPRKLSLSVTYPSGNLI